MIITITISLIFVFLIENCEFLIFLFVLVFLSTILVVVMSLRTIVFVIINDTGTRIDVIVVFTMNVNSFH